ncbi:AraC family transcriptional regulator ligand-binding domain-containing protein [Pseudomonas neustonica]|uniref:AraC family transcriptional regulator ligand-binding domain-containing protein n=1 Tax=Pseudomonas neustonica TaxID=2487346 RepID=UPI003F46F622|tara:strand:+ start:2799 stop:3758 length:960 start_codon:yes stop_codon:yes gene_type:complete
MRGKDKNRVETAKSPVQRYHHGPVGQVLQRFLDQQGAVQEDFSLVELEQLWHCAAQHEPAIGLHLFSFFTRQDWHVLAYVGLFAANVRQSLDSWVRYAGLASSMDRVKYVQSGEQLGVQISLDVPPSLERYLVEHYMTMAITQLREACGHNLMPLRVSLRHPRPDYAQEYVALFGDQVDFAASANQLWFDQASLALPMLGRNQTLFEVVCVELDRRLAQQERFGGVAGKVAVLARQKMLQGETPTLEVLAASLHQTARTLRRRLQEQGLTFRQLLDTVRAELDGYLEMQGLTRAQISEQLGYSDTAAYLHARKRWTVAL